MPLLLWYTVGAVAPQIWQQVEGGVVMVDVSISLIVGVVAGIAANYIYERFIHRNSR